MRRQQVITVLILVALVSTVPLVYAATLSKPTVTLPSGWTQKSETAYPDAVQEYDPAGAGKVIYYNPVNDDNVVIYYEKAQSSFSDSQLQSEAERLFQDYLSDDYTFTESGIVTLKTSGANAGYVRGSNAAGTVYSFCAVLVKGDYYINIMAFYDATDQSSQDVTTVVDSINVGGGSVFSGTMLYVIIGVIVVVVVVVVVLVVVMSRKKKSPQQQPQQAMPSAYPPPPPPPSY